MSRSNMATAGVAVLFLLAMGFQGLRAVGADDQRTDTSVSLAKQEKAIAEEALKLSTELENQGQLNVGRADVPKWSRRLVEATRKSGASKAEVAAAIEQHVSRMDNRLKVVKRLYEAVLVTHGDLLNAQYEALEARSWAGELSGN
jgi:hypothetical protein